jgi:hypothetical protein
MSRSYTSSPPWRLRGVAGYLYFVSTYLSRLLIHLFAYLPFYLFIYYLYPVIIYLWFLYICSQQLRLYTVE